MLDLQFLHFFVLLLSLSKLFLQLLFLFLFHMRIRPYLFNVHLSLHCHAYKVDFPLSFFYRFLWKLLQFLVFNSRFLGRVFMRINFIVQCVLKVQLLHSPVNFKQVYNFIDQLLLLVKETICIIISRIGFFKQSDKSIFEAKGFVLRTCTSLPIYPPGVRSQFKSSVVLVQF